MLSGNHWLSNSKSDDLQKLSNEIEADVTNELKCLLAESAAMTTLAQALPSLRVKKARNTLVQTQDTFIGLSNRLVGKEKTLLDATAYLFWVEVSTNLLADMLIIMLSTKEQPFHIEPDDRYRFTRHATTIDDLESPSVTLAMKLSFLDRCSIKCFGKYVDRTLRNKIAHGDFEISEKGEFFVHKVEDGQIKNKHVDIQRKLDRLNIFNSKVMHQITLALKESKKLPRT